MKFKLEGGKRGACSGEIETPKALREGKWGENIPLHSRLGGLRERRELPQQGPGWCILVALGGRWWQRFSEFFSIHFIAEKPYLLTFLGT